MASLLRGEALLPIALSMAVDRRGRWTGKLAQGRRATCSNYKVFAMGVGIQVSRRETATLATVYDDRMARVEAGLGGGDLSCAGFVANGREWRADKPRERRKLLKAKGLAIILGLEKVDLGMSIAFRRARETSSRFTDVDGAGSTRREPCPARVCGI